MYPGLSEAECQAAGFRYRALPLTANTSQFIAGVCPGPADSHPGTTTFHQRLGVLLVRAGPASRA